VEVIVASLFPLFLWIAARCRPVFAAAATFSLVLLPFGRQHSKLVFSATPVFLLTSEFCLRRFAILAQSLCALILAALFAERRQHETILMASEARLHGALRATQQANHAKSSFLWLPRAMTCVNRCKVRLAAKNPEATFRMPRHALLARIGHSIEMMRGVLTASSTLIGLKLETFAFVQ
jgi:hypothetical protein